MEMLSVTWWVCPLCSRPFSAGTVEGHIGAFHLGSAGGESWRCGDCDSAFSAFADAAAHCLTSFHTAAKLLYKPPQRAHPEELRRLQMRVLSDMQAAAFEMLRSRATALPSFTSGVLGTQLAPALVPSALAPRTGSAMRASTRTPSTFRTPVPTMTPQKRVFRKTDSAQADQGLNSSVLSQPASPALKRRTRSSRVIEVDLDDAAEETAAPPPARSEEEAKKDAVYAGGSGQCFCVQCGETVYSRIEVRTMHKHVVKVHGLELSASGLAQHSCSVCGEVFSLRSAAERHINKNHESEGKVLLDEEYVTAAWECMLRVFPVLRDKWSDDVLTQKRTHFPFYF